MKGRGSVPVSIGVRIDLAKDRDRLARGGGMSMLMAMQRALTVRVVLMVCMVVVMKRFVLDRWGMEKLGVNVDVCPAWVVVVERSDLRLAQKTKERCQNR
jgi:hypothetical protein